MPMLLLLSHSNKIKSRFLPQVNSSTLPRLLDDSELLIGSMKRLPPQAIQAVFNDKPERLQEHLDSLSKWDKAHNPLNACQALLAYQGMEYEGLDPESLSKKDWAFAQQSLRILSGLYGVLRPLDLIQPYHLEMNAPLHTHAGENLVAFWESRITRELLAYLKSRTEPLVNLATDDAIKPIILTGLQHPVIKPVFKDKTQDGYRVIPSYAKRAKGLMARYIIQNRIQDEAGLKRFNLEGYQYSAEDSGPNKPVFLRSLH